MLLQISTTHHPATDLGYLLGKNPAHAQSFELSFGAAHVFYPRATPQSCTAALLLDVDSVALVRGKNGGDGPLSQYVNDRPYAATSFLSVAIARVFRSALSGVSREKPELAASEIPLEIRVSSVPASSSAVLERLFGPLGYEVSCESAGARHQHLTLRATKRLCDALAHLYVLIPVLDDANHYFVADDEVEKLLRRGQGWLENHPQREWIVARYLKKQRRLMSLALEKLAPTLPDEEAQNEAELAVEKPLSLHQIRLETVARALKNSGARRVLDLGCGEGRLLRELLGDAQFEFVLGVDASHRALEIAAEKLRLERLNERQRARVELKHGALTYRDARLEGFDGAAIVEVIEHLEPERLGAFERVVFEFARPKTVVLTTPNSEYNAVWASLPAGKFRHGDHRFEWNRAQFAEWAQGVAQKFGYEAQISPLGPLHEELGAPSQMAVFTARG